MTKSEKEKLSNNIEKLLKKSFYEGLDDDDLKINDVVDDKSERYKFALEYLLRSKCFYCIDHLMQYINIEIDKI